MKIENPQWKWHAEAQLLDSVLMKVKNKSGKSMSGLSIINRCH